MDGRMFLFSYFDSVKMKYVFNAALLFVSERVETAEQWRCVTLLVHSAYQIVVEEVAPQRSRRQVSDCYEVTESLHVYYTQQ